MSGQLPDDGNWIPAAWRTHLTTDQANAIDGIDSLNAGSSPNCRETRRLVRRLAHYLALAQERPAPPEGYRGWKGEVSLTDSTVDDVLDALLEIAEDAPPAPFEAFWIFPSDYPTIDGLRDGMILQAQRVEGGDDLIRIRLRQVTGETAAKKLLDALEPGELARAIGYGETLLEGKRKSADGPKCSKCGGRLDWITSDEDDEWVQACEDCGHETRHDPPN
jgi:hypothetical protein